MKFNQAIAAAFLFATFASSSLALATSSHGENIAPPFPSESDHYLRSHRVLQSSNYGNYGNYDRPTSSNYGRPATSSGSNDNYPSTSQIAQHAGRALLKYQKGLIAGACALVAACIGGVARAMGMEEEAAAVEPTAEKAAEAAAPAV
jgi:hypothetical protein